MKSLICAALFAAAVSGCAGTAALITGGMASIPPADGSEGFDPPQVKYDSYIGDVSVEGALLRANKERGIIYMTPFSTHSAASRKGQRSKRGVPCIVR